MVYRLAYVSLTFIPTSCKVVLMVFIFKKKQNNVVRIRLQKTV